MLPLPRQDCAAGGGSSAANGAFEDDPSPRTCGPGIPDRRRSRRVHARRSARSVGAGVDTQRHPLVDQRPGVRHAPVPAGHGHQGPLYRQRERHPRQGRDQLRPRHRLRARSPADDVHRPAHRAQLPGHLPVQLRARQPRRRRRRPAGPPQLGGPAERRRRQPAGGVRQQVGAGQPGVPGNRVRRRARQVAHHARGARLRRRARHADRIRPEQRGIECRSRRRLLVLADARLREALRLQGASSASRSTAATEDTRPRRRRPSP